MPSKRSPDDYITAARRKHGPPLNPRTHQSLCLHSRQVISTTNLAKHPQIPTISDFPVPFFFFFGLARACRRASVTVSQTAPSHGCVCCSEECSGVEEQHYKRIHRDCQGIHRRRTMSIRMPYDHMKRLQKSPLDTSIYTQLYILSVTWEIMTGPKQSEKAH